VFERFTERARQVILCAQKEARILRHNYIGTEHILLGLLREEEGVAARVLVSLDITVERVRAQVVQIIGLGEEITSGEIPFTPRAKKVVELALSEARALGPNYIGTEHILLGLLREGEGVAARVLIDLVANPNRVREEVLRALETQPETESRPAGGAWALPEQVAVSGGNFERFTERARQVVVLAQEEARILKHNYIGTEHILLGLLREEEGLAGRVLKLLDITVERVRAQVVEIVGSGEDVISGQIPFTPRAKKVLELALREALSLGHNYIGTEHILLGLARENEGVAARVLLDFDADPDTIRNEVIGMLSGPGGRSPFGTDATEPSLERIGLSDALLDGAGPPLRALTRELDEHHGRPADAGDLILLLAHVPDGLAANALAALGIDPETLTRALEEVRSSGARSRLLPPSALATECEKVRAEKAAAIQAHDFARAAELRERERDLLKQAFQGIEAGQEKVLAKVRARLGLSES